MVGLGGGGGGEQGREGDGEAEQERASEATAAGGAGGGEHVRRRRDLRREAEETGECRGREPWGSGWPETARLTQPPAAARGFLEMVVVFFSLGGLDGL